MSSSPTPHYLKSEPHASLSLRLLANGLNGTAYKSFLSPDSISPPHIGFDLEWKPNFRPGEAENPIAVIQIAYQAASYVIHISWMKAIPDGLVEILENPRIVKVGVGIQYDAKKLFKDLGISLNSCVDLSLFVKCVDSGLFAERLDRYANLPLSPQSSTSIPDPPDPSSSRDILTAYYSSEAFLGPHIYRSFRGPYNSSIGLARLAEMYTGIVLTKGKITRSNWEAELTEAQLTYAALDAYAGYIVYAHLINLFNLLSHKPMRRFYAFDCIRGTLYHCSGDSSRTLLAQRMEDSSSGTDAAVFRAVLDEIPLHVQGIGEDQLRGLIPWTQSNPEYDAGPTPPRKTEEEKEAAKIARLKKKEGMQKQMPEGHNLNSQTHMEVRGQRNPTENVNVNVNRFTAKNKKPSSLNIGKSSAPMNTRPQQQQQQPLRSGYATRSVSTNPTTSMQATKVVQPPRAPIVSRNNASASPWRAKQNMVVAEIDALSVGVSKPSGSDNETSVTTSMQVQPPPIVSRTHAPASQWRTKQKTAVANIGSEPASGEVWRPKKSQTKPRPGPTNTVSQPTTSETNPVSTTSAPKRKGKKPSNPLTLSEG